MFGLTPINRRNGNVPGRNDFWDFKSVLDDFFSDSFFPTFNRSGHPIRADIRETDKAYIIDAEIPGVNKDEIKLELRDDVLTISVERDERVDEEKDNYIRRERRYGAFSRSFYVDNVDAQGVEARNHNGVITITLPKKEGGKDNRHRIEIQ